MEYKILINKDSHPVLVEVPEKPKRSCFDYHFNTKQREICEDTRKHQCDCADWDIAKAAAIADESKHIPFSFGDRITIDQHYEYKLIRGNVVDVPDGFNVKLLNQYFDCGEWVKIQPNKIRTVAILSTEPAASEVQQGDIIPFVSINGIRYRPEVENRIIGNQDCEPGRDTDYPEIIAFLMGIGEIDGYSFVDTPKDKRGKFWWRTILYKWYNEFMSPLAQPEPVSEKAEGVAKKIISEIKKGSYEDWVKVISDNLISYTHQERHQSRQEAIQECIDRVIRMAGIDYWQDEKGKDVLGKVCEKLESLKKKAT